MVRLDEVYLAEYSAPINKCGKVLNLRDGVPVRYSHSVEGMVVTARSPVTGALGPMCRGDDHGPGEGRT